MRQVAPNMSSDSAYDLPNPDNLTEAQRNLVKATVPLLEERGVNITGCFYKAMLEANPDLKNVFSNTKQLVRLDTVNNLCSCIDLVSVIS